jgi:Cu/Ag efflux protein CusF
MKSLTIAAAIALASLHSGAFAQSADTAAAATPEASALSEGEVRKIDKAAGKITIKHGPLLNLDMPGMTMSFRVADAATLDKLAVGDAIRFRAEKVDGAYTATNIAPAGK